jgi:hypothetical protein
MVGKQEPTRWFPQDTGPRPWPLDEKCLGWTGHWWLTPVILAIQEAKIKRIVVEASPEHIVLEILSRKKTRNKKGLAKWFKV